MIVYSQFFQPEHVKAFDLGDSSIGSGPLSLETPSKIRNKRKRSSGISNVDGQSPKKRKSSDGTSDDKKQKKTKRGRPSLEKGKTISRVSFSLQVIFSLNASF